MPKPHAINLTLRYWRMGSVLGLLTTIWQNTGAQYRMDRWVGGWTYGWMDDVGFTEFQLWNWNKSCLFQSFLSVDQIYKMTC